MPPPFSIPPIPWAAPVPGRSIPGRAARSGRPAVVDPGAVGANTAQGRPLPCAVVPIPEIDLTHECVVCRANHLAIRQRYHFLAAGDDSRGDRNAVLWVEQRPLH